MRRQACKLVISSLAIALITNHIVSDISISRACSPSLRTVDLAELDYISYPLTHHFIHIISISSTTYLLSQTSLSIYHLFLNSSLDVWRIAFSPDGHTIAAVSDHLELFNADTGQSIRSIQVGTAKLVMVGAVAFSPDGHRIATGRDVGTAAVDADNCVQLGQTLTGQTAQVEDVAFSPVDRQIATVSLDRSLRLWSATVGQSMSGPDPVLLQVAFSPDGQRVAAFGDTVQQWDVSSSQQRPPLSVSGNGGKHFAFVDCGRIVTAADDGTVEVWNAKTGQPASPLAHIALPQGDFHFLFAFRGDGRQIATGENEDGTIQLWDVRTGRALGQPMTITARDTRLIGLAFSPDGHRLVASYQDGMRLWNADTTQLEGTVITSSSQVLPIITVAFSRDGTTIAAGHADGAVDLYDATTRQPLPTSPLKGHTAAVATMAFGIGNQLASRGADETLLLSDTATGKLVAAPLMAFDIVISVALSPDGRLAASATVDGNVLLSPAITDPKQLCDKLTTNMSHNQWREWVSPGIGYITVCPGLPIAPD